MGNKVQRTLDELYENLRSGEVFRIDGMTNLRKDGSPYKHNQQLIPISTSGDDFYAAISVLQTE